jgi:hypothetical protein
MKTSEKGQALVFSYLVITIFLTYSAGLMTRAITEKNIAERAELTAQAIYMAEGANEAAMKSFATAMANFSIATDTASFTTTTTYATINNTVVTTTITCLDASDRTLIEGSTNIYARNYRATSTVAHPYNNAIVVTANQIFARRLIPTFQHAVFYNDDLEILPGADMTLSGRIHCNQDIYSASRADLTVDSDYLRSAGAIYNERKDNPSDIMVGDVSIRKSGTGSYNDMDGLDSNESNWTTEATSRWNETVQSAVHGVTALSAPAVGSISPTGYYATNANVVITNNTIVKGGVTLTEGVDYPTGTITDNTSFYNNREGKYVKMTVVDVAKLSGLTGTCTSGTCSNNLPSNGLLYATRTDASGSDEPGVKLVNAAEIPRTGGLTVVSNDPVYVQGNYNTTSEKPASIITDSVNLLSNNWADSKSTDSDVSNRPATTTTYNTAFVAGIATTTSGHYNGGLENYPRMHEAWSGIDMDIKGSFVQLWNSAIATGAWKYDDPQYTAPNRHWNYNTAYNTPSNLPPFTPWAVETQRVAWWTE